MCVSGEKELDMDGCERRRQKLDATSGGFVAVWGSGSRGGSAQERGAERLECCPGEGRSINQAGRRPGHKTRPEAGTGRDWETQTIKYCTNAHTVPLCTTTHTCPRHTTTTHLHPAPYTARSSSRRPTHRTRERVALHNLSLREKYDDETADQTSPTERDWHTTEVHIELVQCAVCPSRELYGGSGHT